LLVCGCDAWDEASLYVWDLERDQRTMLTSDRGADAIDFAPGNERIVLGHQEEIQVFAWPSGQLLGQVPFKRDNPDYMGLRLLFDGPDQVWVMYHPKGVWRWDLSRGRMKLHRRFRRPNWGESGRWEVGGSLTLLDGRPVLYTWLSLPKDRGARHLRAAFLDTGEEIVRTSLGTNPHYTSDGRHVLIATLGGYGDCEVWDLARGTCCGRIPAGTVCDGPFLGRWPLSPEGRYIAWWDNREEEHQIKVWDTCQERLVQQIPTPGHYIPCDFSPTHRLLLAEAMTWGRESTPEDRTLLLDPLTGACLGQADLLPFFPAPEFSPGGRWVALGVGHECAQWYDCVPTGTVLLTDLASLLPLATPVGGGA
jgi:hypothetical protein